MEFASSRLEPHYRNAGIVKRQQGEMMENRLWSPDDVAQYLAVPRRQFLERIAPKPTFPRPVRLPTSGRGTPRWIPEEVKEFVEGLR
jgi:predicted DNA-binding transcriptional regulator AlpA